MSDTLAHAFFYNSQGGDRIYDADSFEYWLKKFFTTGVFTGDCQVVANDDTTVTVKPGYTNVEGKVKVFLDDQILQLETAGSTYGRIDTVVIERNDTERDVFVKVITGGYSSDPIPTAPVRENGVYQLVIAQISVAAGATRITQEEITDTRMNSDLCGIVTGAVDQFDFSQFPAQFNAWMQNQIEGFSEWSDGMLEQYESYLDDTEAAITAWFDTIKNQLDTDAATSLQTVGFKINITVSSKSLCRYGYCV